jgi:hypothetical protein
MHAKNQFLSCDGFARLVDFIGGVRRDDELPPPVALLHAYFDESGKWADRDTISFGGFVSTAEHWEHFAKEWSALLDKLDFPYLHTSEFVGLDGVYAKHRNKIKAEDIEPILSRFAEIIQKYVNHGYGVGVDTKHYRSMSQAFRAKVKNPQFIAFKLAMNMVTSQVDVVQGLFPAYNWKAGIICDQDSSTSDHCLKWFTKFRTFDAKARRLINGICFADSTGIPPVQAADLLAFVLRGEVERRRTKSQARPTMLCQRLMTRRDVTTGKLIPFFRGNVLDAKTLDEMASGKHSSILSSMGIEI